MAGALDAGLGTVTMLTIKTFGLRWFQTDNIYPFYNPQRWVGYLAAGFILYGIGDILVGRWRAQKEIYKETKFNDLVFPVLIVCVVLSGLVAHILRYCGFGLELSLRLRAARHHCDSTAADRDVVRQVVAHGLSPDGPLFRAVKERAQQQAPAPEAVPNAI